MVDEKWAMVMSLGLNDYQIHWNKRFLDYSACKFPNVMYRNMSVSGERLLHCHGDETR